MRGREPIARLVPVKAPTEGRGLGMDRGVFDVPEDFDDPLPGDVGAQFEG